VIGQEAGKSFAYILGVYLGDGCVTTWRAAGKSDRLIFRLNTIDEDFAQATKTALAQLTDYTVTLSRHAVSKSSKPNGAVAGVVGIEVGVVSGVFNLESSGVDAPEWRPRHEEH
jgi:hypothetical protein